MGSAAPWGSWTSAGTWPAGLVFLTRSFQPSVPNGISSSSKATPACRSRSQGRSDQEEEFLLPIRSRNRSKVSPPSGGRDRALRPAQALARRLELAAGGQDVAPARGAYRAGVARILEDAGEGADAVVGGAGVGRARPGVERDQV